MSSLVDRRSMSLVLALGTLGAASLILASLLFTPGKYILLPYSAFIIGTAVVLRTTHVSTYRDRFAVGLGAYIIATLALYLYTALVLVPHSAAGHVATVSLLGHVSRLAALLVVGIVVNAAIARVAE